METTVEELNVSPTTALLHSQPYQFQKSHLPGVYEYYFMTDDALEYEVRFAQRDIFNYIVNFGLMYHDNEYEITNKGDLYKIIGTVVSSIQDFLNDHPEVKSLSFSGSFKEEENEEGLSVRSKLFCRAAKRWLDESWEVICQDCNKVEIRKR